tara:strand:+ start:877 stop:1461 length:585 start_codon:yes stop_codon:yes gene_type:complete
MLLRGFALSMEAALLHAVDEICDQAPMRNMVTPGGHRMSVGMTNCGDLGWISTPHGYRYASKDPESGNPWPAMPECFLQLAASAAQAAGFDGFRPDACLINCYEPGSRLTLHQDKNERDFAQPIVSVSLGMSAVFQFGGLKRSAPCGKLLLEHGDVVVWGRADRLRFHGVLPLKGEPHPLLGERRINLTFRKAG